MNCREWLNNLLGRGDNIAQESTLPKTITIESGNEIVCKDANSHCTTIKKLDSTIKFKFLGQTNYLEFRFGGAMPEGEALVKYLKGLSVKIVGSNNHIIISADKIRASSINIEGDINQISITASAIVNSELSMWGDGNKFTIEPTTYPFKSAFVGLSNGTEMHIGKNTHIMQGLYAIANDEYKGRHKILIGDDVDIGLRTIIRTSDGHALIDPVTRMAINEPQDVIIGNHVWMGSRCTVLKGASIAEGCVVGAGSIVNKKFAERNCVIAGAPAIIRKRDISWDRRSYGAYMQDFENGKV